MVPLFDLQSVIVAFHGHSHLLANIVFSGMIKYYYWQKMNKLSQENILKLLNILNDDSVLLHMLWA